MTLRQAADGACVIREESANVARVLTPAHTFVFPGEDCFATSIRICAFLLLLYCDVSNEILWFTRDARLAWRYSVYENIRSPL